MNEILHFLENHGAMLIVGASVLLAVGVAALVFHRAPINRQRAGELTIMAVLAWMLLACIPLPRWSTNELLSQTSPTTTAPSPPESLPAYPSLPMVIQQDQSADEAARIHESAQILAQLAQLDAEESILSPVDVDLPVDDSLQSPNTTIAVAAAAMNPNSPGPALAAGDVSWRQIVAALYLGGAALCAAWIALGRFLLFRLTRRAISPHGWLRELYTSLSPEPLPRLLVSSRCRRAFSCGWWRPTIMLPLECCEESRAEQLRQILLHELAHLQQGDQRGRVLFNIALPLLYVHPLYWWIRSRTYLAAELVADDWAAGHSSTTAYAGELIALVKEQGRRGMAHVGTVGIFSSPTQFYRRMEMLVRRQTPLMTTCTRRWRLLTTLTATVAVILLSSTLGVRLVQAEPDDGENQVETVEAAPAEELSAEETPLETNATTDSPVESAPIAAEDQPATPDRFGKGLRSRVLGRGAREDLVREGPVDDDDSDGGFLRGGGGRFGMRGRRGGDLAEFFEEPDGMLNAIKSKHREVLIMRLQLINRRPSDKEQQIRKVLTEENTSDAELIAQLYKNVLQRPVNAPEMALVEQILKLSDNRGESIRRMLESMDEFDEAAAAALTVLELEPQLTNAEAQLRELSEQVKNLPADLNDDEAALEAARKVLKISKRSGEKVSSWNDVAELLYRRNDSLARTINDMKRTMAELAKLDKELQKQQNDVGIGISAPYDLSTTRPQTVATPPTRQRGAVVKRVPVMTRRKTPDGRTVYELKTVEERQIDVPVNELDPQATLVPAHESDTVQSYAPPQSDAPTYNVPRPSTNESRRTPPEPNRHTPPVPTTQQQIEPVPDSRLPSTHHDVIKLATDYSQTHSELDSAKRAYERIQQLKEKNAVSQTEFEEAAEKLASMRERLKTMQTIAEILQESLQEELAALQIEMEQAGKTKDEVRKAQLRTRFAQVSGDLKILQTMK